jgi:hypothetical protein
MQALDVSRSMILMTARPRAAIVALTEAAAQGRHLPRYDLAQKPPQRPAASGPSFLDHLRLASPGI